MGHGQGQSIFKVRLTYVTVTEMILCKYEHNLPNDKIVELPKSTLEEDWHKQRLQSGNNYLAFPSK